MEAIEAFLLKEVLSWLYDKISAIIKVYETDKANQSQQSAQAAQDTDKAGKLSPDSTQEEISEAISEELKHM